MTPAMTTKLIEILEEEKKAVNEIIEALRQRKMRTAEGLVMLCYQGDLIQEDVDSEDE